MDISVRVASTHLAPILVKGLSPKQEAAGSSPQGFGTSWCHEELLQGASVLLQPEAEMTRPASARKRTSLISLPQRSRIGFLNWNQPLPAWRAPPHPRYRAGAAIHSNAGGSVLPAESKCPKWKAEGLTCFLVSQPTGNWWGLFYLIDLLGIAKGAFPSLPPFNLVL